MTCRRGYCSTCGHKQANAYICPTCDALCSTTADQEGREARDRQRARAMSEEIPTIAGYPLTDTVAFVILSVVVWAFGLAAKIAAFGGGYGVLFSQGLLMAYAFTAINRVSAGHLAGYMPSISDITDLAHPLRLGLAAMIISAGPLLAVLFIYPFAEMLPQAAEVSSAVVFAQDDSIDDEEIGDTPEAPEGSVEEGRFEGAGLEAEKPSALGWILLLGALVWNVVYSPIALTTAAISRSFFTTLNPAIGLRSIATMGSTYWQAMGIYTVIALINGGVGFGLGLVPLVGGLVKAFLESYAYLAIGCTLGLAVFKKAPELGLD